MKNNLHNAILARLREERQVVTVIITNGFRIKGRITGFDDFVVVLEVRNEQNIVCRHAISTVIPNQPIDLDSLKEEEQGCQS